MKPGVQYHTSRGDTSKIVGSILCIVFGCTFIFVCADVIYAVWHTVSVGVGTLHALTYVGVDATVTLTAVTVVRWLAIVINALSVLTGMLLVFLGFACTSETD